MGTNDEMCFGGITFYPQQNVKHQFCTTWKSIPVCLLRKPVIRGCHINQFANISHPEFVDMREAIMDHCSTNSTCFKECACYSLFGKTNKSRIRNRQKHKLAHSNRKSPTKPLSGQSSVQNYS
jgi:hypothetical protein